MKRMLRAEWYKLRCSWWFFPLLLFLAFGLVFFLWSGYESLRHLLHRSPEDMTALGLDKFSQEELRQMFTSQLLKKALTDGRPALFTGLMVSVWFYSLERLSRGSVGPVYAGVPRMVQSAVRLLLTLCFGVVTALLMLLFHLARAVPGWTVGTSVWTICYWLGAYLLAAASAVSLNVLAAAIPKDFFTSTVCTSAVSILGLLLARETGEPSVWRELFCWYPVLLQRSSFDGPLAFFALTGIIVLCVIACVAVYQRRNLQ